jgi:hypothetical protein
MVCSTGGGNKSRGSDQAREMVAQYPALLNLSPFLMRQAWEILCDDVFSGDH